MWRGSRRSSSGRFGHRRGMTSPVWDDIGMADASDAVEHDGAVRMITIVIPETLQPLLYSHRRRERVSVVDDGVSTIGHVVGSLGIPPTEIGTMRRDESTVDEAWRPTPGAVVRLTPRPRPQATPTVPPRFVLDVHLGTLARRLRLLGIDATWRNDAADDELIEAGQREQRVILTRDRALLLRRAARGGAYVRGNDPAAQLDDVIDRFAPPLAPWTRCPACNGLLAPVAKTDVVDALQPGTRRNYDTFARCTICARIYWDGAHHARLQRIVDRYARST